jgi:hypothetical protein
MVGGSLGVLRLLPPLKLVACHNYKKRKEKSIQSI